MIPQGIPEALLSVLYDRVIPIYHIQRAVRPELQVNRAEIRIFGLQQRNSFIGNDTTSCFLRYMLATSLKANKCIKKYISLHRFRKGSAGNNLYPTGLRFCLCGQEITHATKIGRASCRERVYQYV